MAQRGGNREVPIYGLSIADGKTLVQVAANPTNHALKVSNGTSVVFSGTLPAESPRDKDRIPAIRLQRSDGTLGYLMVDSNGYIQIQST